MISLNIDSLRRWQNENLEQIRYDYDLKPEDTVLDIGSYQREWGKEMVLRYGCKVEYFDALDNRAAWKFDGEIELGGQYLYSSILLTEGKRKCGCVDIAPFLQQEIAVCKINIEGGEYALMNYIIEKGLHKNVKNFQIQFHEVSNFDYDTFYQDIADELLKTHSLTWRYPFCWENWKRNA